MDDAGIRRSLSSIKDSFREVRQSARTNLNNIKFNDKDAKGYKKSMDELSNTFDQQQNNVNDLKSRYDELAAAGKENTQEGQRLRNEYNKQVDELNRLGHQLEQAKQGYFDLKVESNTFSKVGKNITGVSDQFKDLGTRLSDVGGALTRKVTLPAVGAATAVGGIVASFGWGRLVGLDSAQAQLKGLGYNTEEVGRISDQVTSAIEGGMTTMAEGTAVAAGAMAAGVEEGAELERYIKLVGDAAVGSNRPVEEMAQIFNRVQGSGKLMTQELNMIEQGMPGFAAAMAKNLGVPQDEFREMVTAGEISSEEFMDVMDDFAGGMAEAYADSWEGMVANTKAYIGILGENLLGGVFEESKESIAELIDLLSSEEAQEWAAEIGETIGKAFGSIIETVKDAVKWFTSLDSSQQKLVGKLALVAVAAGPVLSIFGTMTTIFGNILEPIGSLFTNFGRLSEAIGDAGGFTQLFKGDMESLGMAFPGLTSVLGTVKGAFGKVAGAIMGISAPVAITVGAVVALGAGFVIAYKKSETFRNFISSIGDMLSGALQSIVDFKDNVVTAFEAVFSIFKGDRMGGAELLQSIGLSDETIQTIISYVSVIRRKFFEMRDKIQEALSAVGDFFRKIFDGIGEWWTNNGETILGYVTAGFEWMQETIGLVLDLVAAIWDRTWSVIKGTIEILWPIVSGIISDGINKIVDLFNFFAPIVTEIWNTLWPILQAVVEGVWERIKLVVGTAMDVIQGVIQVATAIINGDWSAAWDAVKETIANVKDRVVEYLGNMKDIAVDLIRFLVGDVIDWFGELWQETVQLGDRISEVWENVKKWTSEIWDSIADSIFGFIIAIEDNFSLFMDRVLNVFSSGWYFVYDLWEKALSKVMDNTSEAFQEVLFNIQMAMEHVWIIIDTIWNFVKNTFLNATAFLKALVSGDFAVMKDMIREQLYLIVETMATLWDQATAVFKYATEAIKEFTIAKFSELKESVSAIFNSIKDTVLNVVGAIAAPFVAVFDFIKDTVVDIVGSMASSLITFFESIFEGISVIADALKTLVIAAFNYIKDRVVYAVGNMVEPIINFYTIMYNEVNEIVIRVRDIVINIFNVIKEKVVNIVHAMVEPVLNTFNLIKNTVIDIVSRMVNSVVGWFTDLWSKVTGKVNQTKDNTVATFTVLKDATIARISEMVNVVVQWFQNLWQKVTNKTNQIKDTVTTIFRNIKNAVVDRIKEMVSLVVNRFLDLFNNIRDRVNSIKTTTVRVFTDMKNNVLNRVKSLYTGVTDHFKNTYNSIKTWMTNAKDSAVGLAIDMKDQVIQKAKDILDYFKKLPGRLGNAISNGSNAFKGGFAKMLNAGISSVESGVNSIIKGINWVLDKLGASKIDTWSAGRVAVPAYAKGTDGHPEDGPAIVGDGGMKELIAYPNGQIGMSPDTDTLVNMPKGTQVMSGPDTKSFMNSMGIPKYKSGIGKAWDTVKNITGDFWNWASSGAKGLLDKSLGFLGISAPSSSDGPGIFGDVAKGAFGTIKDGAIGFIQDKIDDLFSFGGVNFPGFTKTSGFGPRNSPGGIGSTNHMGVDFAAPAGTPIPAQAGGQVTKSGWFGGLGNMVETTSGNTKYRYGHNSKNLVSIGDSVSPGQKIALVGSTGNSTGPHVHFEVIHNGKHVDPMTFGGGDAPAAGGGSGVGKWRNTAMQALRMTNQFTPANLNALMNQMSTESGGNPRAQNNWDINARRGTPSKGLMQVIDPTFQAFKMPGFNNIWNPMDNILASIRYATSRYGSLTNAYRGIGYADGGIVSTPGVYALAENGYPEFVIPTEPSKRGNAMKLLALAAKRLQKGNTQVSYSSGGSSEAVLGADMSETNNLLKTLIELIAQGQTLVADDKVMAEVLFGQIEKTMNKNYSRENIMRIKRGE